MNWADYIIIGILGLSVLIGLWRGLISELLALVIWSASFWVAWTFGPSVSMYFAHSISLPSARIFVGYGICFLTVLLAGAMLRFLVKRLIAGTGLSGTDRLFGTVFGFARGVLLVTLVVFLVGLTPLTRDPWWRESALLPQFKGVVAWLGDSMPESVRHYLQSPPALLDHMPDMPAMPVLPTFPAALPATLPGMLPMAEPARAHSAPAVDRANVDDPANHQKHS
ncbi:CvpA family protein [Dyella tabacisoli]|uniref:CvpA family protein n=1 Tax=Dyella tabacisoli TaxID=2282381 RepID=A0A369US55_9GAMM|nr:CvpA family protein [Dyella tabacisoli]RDD83351.1 CvpA family protein [Dyella tabacisoli]